MLNYIFLLDPYINCTHIAPDSDMCFFFLLLCVITEPENVKSQQLKEQTVKSQQPTANTINKLGIRCANWHWNDLIFISECVWRWHAIRFSISWIWAFHSDSNALCSFIWHFFRLYVPFYFQPRIVYRPINDHSPAEPNERWMSKI